MNEKDLGKAMINQAGSNDAASGEIAARVLRRDRLIIRVLAGGTIVLWAIAATGILMFNVGFMTYLFPMMQRWAATGVPDDRLPLAIVRLMYTYGSPVLMASACAMIMAAIGTVALILFSRHASLRQINRSLAIISDQLRELRTLRP